MKLLLTGAFSYTSEQLKQFEAMGADVTFVQDEREAVSYTHLTLPTKA